jgi:hypothetical protein
MTTRLLAGLTLLAIAAGLLPADDKKPEPVQPTEVIRLFNGKDFTGLSTWLNKTQREDPKKVFTVEDGMLHISGEDNGYVSTDKPYRDYIAVVEYKWGKRTDGRGGVRNSGMLLHATGPDGGAGKGTWMSSIECQIAQGCVGDLIVIRGKDEKDQVIPVQLTSDVEVGPDKRPRWKKGGEKRVFTGGQLWWNQHEPFFKEDLDTRGKNDVESPLGEWTRIESRCEGKTITVTVNGHVINHAYDVFPAVGKLLLQSEGFEVYVRKWELQPLKK